MTEESLKSQIERDAERFKNYPEWKQQSLLSDIYSSRAQPKDEAVSTLEHKDALK